MTEEGILNVEQGMSNDEGEKTERYLMESKRLKSLSGVKDGRTVKLASVNAGRGLNSRLASMGLVPNTEITVVNNGHPGPFVIKVKNSKMVLGRGMASKIMVFEEE